MRPGAASILIHSCYLRGGVVVNSVMTHFPHNTWMMRVITESQQVKAVSQGQECRPGTLGTTLGIGAHLPACRGVGGWAVRAVRGSKMTSY